MTNEAIILESPLETINYICSDNSAITKGALLWFSDPNTVSGASVILNSCAPFAGIAAADKKAADGSTTIGCHTRVIADLFAVGGVTAGELVSLSGQNIVTRAAVADVLSGAIVGKAMETATAAGEVIRVRVGAI